MNDKIKLILDNLDKTILGKNQLLVRLEFAADEVSNVTAAFLKLNVDELVRIRDDIRLLVEPEPVQVEVDPRQMDLPL